MEKDTGGRGVDGTNPIPIFIPKKKPEIPVVFIDSDESESEDESSYSWSNDRKNMETETKTKSNEIQRPEPMEIDKIGMNIKNEDKPNSKKKNSLLELNFSPQNKKKTTMNTKKTTQKKVLKKSNAKNKKRTGSFVEGKVTQQDGKKQKISGKDKQPIEDEQEPCDLWMSKNTQLNLNLIGMNDKKDELKLKPYENKYIFLDKNENSIEFFIRKVIDQDNSFFEALTDFLLIQEKNTYQYVSPNRLSSKINETVKKPIVDEVKTADEKVIFQDKNGSFPKKAPNDKVIQVVCDHFDICIWILSLNDLNAINMECFQPKSDVKQDKEPFILWKVQCLRDPTYFRLFYEESKFGIISGFEDVDEVGTTVEELQQELKFNDVEFAEDVIYSTSESKQMKADDIYSTVMVLLSTILQDKKHIEKITAVAFKMKQIFSTFASFLKALIIDKHFNFFSEQVLNMTKTKHCIHKFLCKICRFVVCNYTIPGTKKKLPQDMEIYKIQFEKYGFFQVTVEFPSLFQLINEEMKKYITNLEVAVGTAATKRLRMKKFTVWNKIFKSVQLVSERSIEEEVDAINEEHIYSRFEIKLKKFKYEDDKKGEWKKDYQLEEGENKIQDEDEYLFKINILKNDKNLKWLEPIISIENFNDFSFPSRIDQEENNEIVLNNGEFFIFKNYMFKIFIKRKRKFQPPQFCPLYRSEAPLFITLNDSTISAIGLSMNSVFKSDDKRLKKGNVEERRKGVWTKVHILSDGYTAQVVFKKINPHKKKNQTKNKKHKENENKKKQNRKKTAVRGNKSKTLKNKNQVSKFYASKNIIAGDPGINTTVTFTNMKRRILNNKQISKINKKKKDYNWKERYNNQDKKDLPFQDIRLSRGRELADQILKDREERTQECDFKKFNSKPDTLSLNKKYKDSIIKSTERMKEIQNYIDQNEEIKDYFVALGRTNGHSNLLESFLEYAKIKNANTFDFFSDKKWQQARFQNKQQTQKYESRFVNRTLKHFKITEANKDQFVFAIGNWAKNTVHLRNNAPVIQKRIIKLLISSGVKVVVVNEMYTSKRCSNCKIKNAELQKVIIDGRMVKDRNNISKKSEEPWALKKCNCCGTFWNRDINAAQNIHFIAKEFFDCRCVGADYIRPTYLTK